MGGWCDCDLDDVLAYSTVKTVKVRHRWLGGIYYTSIILILICAVAGFEPGVVRPCIRVCLAAHLLEITPASIRRLRAQFAGFQQGLREEPQNGRSGAFVRQGAD